MTLNIQAFIFDLDGVITDTAELHYLSWQHVCEEEGLPFNREINEALRGISRRESLNRILKGQPIEEARAVDIMKRKNDYYLELLETLSSVDLLPGVLNTFNAAKAAGIKVGLGSASRNARLALEKLGVIGLFDAISDGHSVVNTKPAPDLFLWAAGRLDVFPPHAVIFEDAEAGIEAAKAGGFWSVGMAGQDGSGSERVGGANIVLNDLDLPLGDLLEKLNTAAQS